MENQEPPTPSPDQDQLLEAFFRTYSPLRRGNQARSRPSATPSTVLQRHRLLRSQGNADNLSESPNTVQETVDRLTELAPVVTPFLPDPTSGIATSNSPLSEYYGAGEGNKRKSKRRKMDQEPVLEENKYGYRGRVVPGPLKMDIMSCDGGFITEVERSDMVCYSPQNLLRNDKSVYCTQTGECNMIFRHMGNQPFTLKKVVIKAPKSGFDAPIQEGMIFVSMTSDHLLARTAQYRLREKKPPVLPTARTPPENHTEVGPASTAPRPSAQVQAAVFRQLLRPSDDDRPPSRRTGNAADMIPFTRFTNHSPSYPRRFGQGVGLVPSPLVDFTSPPRNRSSTLPVSVQPIHSSTASYEDSSADEEEETSPSVLADLADRCRRDYPFSSSSEDDDEEGTSQATRRRIRRLRASPRKIVWEDLGDPEGVGPVDLTPKVEMLAPHANFFIDSKQGMVSVKFDPPVTGKFILFKLWSPVEGQNIDIQSIMCYGFGGPRYFPALEMR